MECTQEGGKLIEPDLAWPKQRNSCQSWEASALLCEAWGRPARRAEELT